MFLEFLVLFNFMFVEFECKGYMCFELNLNFIMNFVYNYCNVIVMLFRKLFNLNLLENF